MSSTAVQLVFVGEVLPGFSQAQVRASLGRRLRLDEQRLAKLFSGQRVVIKRDLSPAEAADWVQRFQAIGAVLHATPIKAPKPTEPPRNSAPQPPTPVMAPATPARRVPAPPPDSSIMLSLVPDSEMPPAPPPPPSRPATPSRAAAAAANSGAEEVICPNCAERQSKRVICRSCLCDMPRTLASQRAEAEVRRQARLEEQRARNEKRLAQEALLGEEDLAAVSVELPPLLSLSPEGRMGRLRFLSISSVGLALAIIAIVAAYSQVLVRPKVAMLVPMGLAGLVLLLWWLRGAALRLHDFSKSGWWALLMLVPVVNGLFALALLFWPGDREENDYGSPVGDGHWLWALLGLVVVGTAAALNSPKIMGAVLKAVA